MHRSRALKTPVGSLRIEADGACITSIIWGAGPAGSSPILAEAVTQITEYFAGTRTAFALPLDLPKGGTFRRRFLDALLAIPFGETRTYGDLARELDAPAQAIGQACGGNRIPLIIPCHRVLAADSLGGYSGAGGIETKVALLRHEGAAGLLI